MSATNEERATLAWEACVTFAEMTDQDIDAELDDVISDLIADLLHLARANGLSPDAMLQRAEMHYMEETENLEGSDE